MAFRVSPVNREMTEMTASTKTKFMQMLDSQTYRALQKEAQYRGASIQELLRTVIIPDWLTENQKRVRK